MTELTVRGSEEHTARNMADALTYLGRVASDAGYHSVVTDIHVLRDRLASIARAEEEAKRGMASA
ncbi:hypothetical protein [Bradyrhizobium sp. ERR14]|uniref:hypothetical protein n=1 Tax=Bradyrhizobium sp. ERR14 TaxID=2663837 RepID=UPI0016087FB4|nr:hypothetical protein [Bradyrhizobium sp. ERR14]MBB4398540.1 hypothetical protein [Bradyrhizobium sp. ERR14]